MLRTLPGALRVSTLTLLVETVTHFTDEETEA